MYYAMIVAIDRTYYEAAVMDGAGRWQQIVHITLPGIKPTIVILYADEYRDVFSILISAFLPGSHELEI